jgi:superoxide dismutase, Cu-Zn family
MIRYVLSFCSLLSALALVAGAQAADDHDHKHEPVAIKDAVCILVPMKASGVNGTILLKQEKGYARVTGEVMGLKPGKHGFHIHMFGDLRAADGMSVGGHYNPHGHPHGGVESKERHEGDLGNIEADAQGVAKVDVKADHVVLNDVIGRSIVVHGDADDLKSQPAGNAGPRIAVGVIGMAEVKAPATATKK